MRASLTDLDALLLQKLAELQQNKGISSVNVRKQDEIALVTIFDTADLAKPKCKLAPDDTKKVVDRYGVNTEASKKAFMDDFALVLRKMLRHGYGNTLQTI